MAEAIAVRGALVRGDACWKCPTLKREKKTGKEIDRKIKWDKRYVVLTDTKPSAVYWYKSDAAFTANKKANGFIELDSARLEMEDGTGDQAGSTILTITSPERTLLIRFENDAKATGANWYQDLEKRCATGDVVANAVAIQARFRARGEQKAFEESKAAATKVQALVRGKATREKIAQESLPFRVMRIVNAMDVDGGGTVETKELAQFFEVLQLQTGVGKGDPPKVQAQKIMARLTKSDDATSVDTLVLAEFLTKTFSNPKGAARIEKMEKAMLQLPVRARVVIDPDPPDRAGVDADQLGMKGVLVGYYNEERWCYVALDGEGPEEEWADEESRKRPFKVDVVKDDPASLPPEGVPPARSGGASGGASGGDGGGGGGTVDDYADEDEYGEADAVESDEDDQ